MRVKLIIFDLDGTLADTAADMADALNAVLPPGVLPISLKEARTVMGGGEDTLAARFAEGNWDPHDRRDFGRRFSEAYASRLAVHTKIYPGVRKTLGKLSMCAKVVLSNRRRNLTVPVLERFGLLDYFLEVFGMDSGAGMKPSPEPVLHVLRQLAISPDETIIVGDCMNDIQAGYAAGVRTVAVTYGYGLGRGFIERADFAIDRFPQLLQVIMRLGCMPGP